MVQRLHVLSSLSLGLKKEDDLFGHPLLHKISDMIQAYLASFMAACAAASRAMGTLKGEQETYVIPIL